MTQIKKNIKEIAFVTGTSQKELASCHKKLKQILPEQLMSQTPQDHVKIGCERLELSSEVTEQCFQTVNKMTELEVMTGKKPATIAGVAMWMVINKHAELLQTIKSPMMIQKALGIKSVHQNILLRYAEVEPIENLILPQSLKR